MTVRGWHAAAFGFGFLCGCVPPPGGDPVDAGRQGGGGDHLTELPAGWRDRCVQQQHPGDLAPLCDALGQAAGPTAERIAFGLNLAASEAGVFPAGLGALHFAHGRFAGWSVRDLAIALADPNTPDVSSSDLDDLAIAVNRAFVDGEDARTLAPWITTPLCGAPNARPIEGPASARCGLLDAACSRGVFDEASACCTAQLAPIGAVCEGGLCAEDGRCVPQRRVRTAERVRGAASWVEVLSGGQPRVWHLPGELARIAVEPALVQPPPEPDPVPDEDWESWQSTFGARRGASVGVVDAALVEATRIHVGRAAEAPVVASAIHAAAGARALSLPGAPGTVCVIRGRDLDAMAPIVDDCSTTNALVLACPGANGDVSCALEDDHAVVRGPDLTLAFALEADGPPELEDPTFHAVVPHVFPERVCAGHSCARLLGGPPAGPAGPIGGPGGPGGAPCSFGGCTGRRVCQLFVGCYCARPSERCNGVDDDCDGVTDDGADALCEDGVACTVDVCEGAAGCGQAGPGWNGAGCTPAYCAKGVCNGDRPAHVDPRLPLGPADANGCQLALDDAFCEGVLDRCVCNGTSVCDPVASVVELDLGRATGCSQTSPRATPLQFWPCENPAFPLGDSGDGDLCTNEVCCEPNAQCRYLNPLNRQPAGSTQIVSPSHQLCTSFLVPRRRGGPGPGGRPICVDFSGQSTGDRIALHCNDGDPCTDQVCSAGGAATGVCNNPQIMGATEPVEVSIFGVTQQLDGGCQGEHPDGCAQLACSSIAGRNGCNLAAPFVPRFGNSETCSAIFPNPPPGDCAVHACDGVGGCGILSNDSLCEDGLDCTIDACSGFLCDFSSIDPSKCLINGECLEDGFVFRQDEFCGVCRSLLDQHGWSPCE